MAQGTKLFPYRRVRALSCGRRLSVTVLKSDN